MTRVHLFLIFKYIKKLRDMYSIDCSYYEDEFDSIYELINDVMRTGMDPNYEITYNGVGTGEECVDFIVE